jgi:hypothetical protein
MSELKREPIKTGDVLAVVDTWRPQAAALLVDRIYVPSPDYLEGLEKHLSFAEAPPAVLTFDVAEIGLNPYHVFMASVHAVRELYGEDAFLNPTDEQIQNPQTTTRTLQLQSAAIRSAGHRCFTVFGTRSSEYHALPEGDDFVLTAILQNIPVVDSESLSWPQILQFRGDNISSSAYRSFHLWLSNFKPQSEREATDIIGKKLHDYENALKKHGIESKRDTAKLITSLPSRISALGTGAGIGVATGTALFGLSASPAAAAIGALLFAGLSLGGDIVAMVSERRIRKADLIHGPSAELAYLQQVSEQLTDNDAGQSRVRKFLNFATPARGRCAALADLARSNETLRFDT